MDVKINSLTNLPEPVISQQNSIVSNNKINIVVISIILIILIGYFSLISSLGNIKASYSPLAESSDNKNSINNIEIILWVIFVVLIIINGMTFIFDIDIVASLKDVLTSKPEINVDVITDDIKIPEINKKQVFHISDNKYTYEDAKAICKAYDSKLANYKEMEEAYKNGADWCGFGWSDGQLALYPTQFEKWTRFQKIKGHEHDCGRPGVNGGYIANPKIRYGINCYGLKPQINDTETQNMANIPLYPKTKKEIDFDKKVEKWKEKIPNILISPFNHNNWSVI